MRDCWIIVTEISSKHSGDILILNAYTAKIGMLFQNANTLRWIERTRGMEGVREGKEKSSKQGTLQTINAHENDVFIWPRRFTRS